MTEDYEFHICKTCEKAFKGRDYCSKKCFENAPKTEDTRAHYLRKEGYIRDLIHLYKFKDSMCFDCIYEEGSIECKKCTVKEDLKIMIEEAKG